MTSEQGDMILAIIPWSGRTTIKLTGADRASFLHNLCTNEIKALRPGNTTEAFITNVQGKTIGHVLVACRDDELLLTTVPGQADTLMSHFERYLITENVELSDVSNQMDQLLVSGQCSVPALSELTGQPIGVGTNLSVVSQSGITIWPMPYIKRDCFALVGEPFAIQTARAGLLVKGAVEADSESLEPARIVHGFPWFGIDLSAENLPQELNRDQQAISFEKGCYLGQETVARIDALGHVNKMLMRLAGQGEVHPTAELEADGTTVGQLTSVAEGEVPGEFVGLGYVRRGHLDPGTRLTCGGIEVEVVG